MLSAAAESRLLDILAARPRPLTEELCSLGHRGSAAILQRLQRIVENCDPRDQELRRFMQKLLLDSRDVLEACASPGWQEGRASLPGHLIPCLGESLGEARLCRDVALFLVERLKEDSCRFFRWLARQAADEEMRAQFIELAEGEDRLLTHCRTVLLGE